MKHNNVKPVFVLALILLAACSAVPSEKAVQTAIAKTNAIMPTVTTIPSTTETSRPTNTPIPTYTPLPTNTPVPTVTPLPSITPTNQPGSRSNPYLKGEPVSFTLDATKEFTITIVEILRGDDARSKVKAANMFNSEAPDGMEYVVVKVVAEYTKGPTQDTVLELNDSMFGTVSNGEIIDKLLFVVAPDPDFTVKLFPGGKKEGYIVKTVYTGDENTLLYFGDIGNYVQYFSLKP